MSTIRTPTLEPLLFLPMKKEWFDLVRSGEKKEEYRECKRHWMVRLDKCIPRFAREYNQLHSLGHFRATPPLNICFVNGYQKNAPRFLGICNVFQIRINAIHPEWGEGEYEGKLHFAFRINHIEEYKDRKNVQVQ